MSRKNLLVALAALLLVPATSARAHAWGAYHAGFTHIGPDGVQHYGRTGFAGPLGLGGFSRYAARPLDGYPVGDAAYRPGGLGYGGAYHYGGAYYDGPYGGGARYDYAYRY